MTGENLQPTYKRQRFLLSYIRQLNGGVTATDIQKLVFLHTVQGESDYYDFVPYRYGPYSFQLAEDIDILYRDHFLERNDSRIHAIGEYPRERMFSLPNARGDELIGKVYREYPYYAMNSDILGRFFNEEEADRIRGTRRRFSQQDQVLFTIGYEGKSVESFMNILIQKDVRLLCDVRKNPLSRKFGFSKSRLSSIADWVKVEYVHIPGLGIESEKRVFLRSKDDYRCLFDDYAKTLPSRKPFLDEVYALMRKNHRVALMCYEKEPEMCHRHVVRDYLVDAYEMESVDL